jgi:hypothetical protein
MPARSDARPLSRKVPNRGASKLFIASLAFALNPQARLPLVPRRAKITWRQDSLDATDRPLAHPKERLTPGSDAGGTRI